MRLFYIFLSIAILYISSIYAGTTQEQLLNFNPTPNASDVNSSISPSFTFTKAIVETSVKRRTIVLRQISPTKKRIKGNIGIKDKNTLVFMPSKPLEKGTYEIKVKPIKLLKEKQTNFEPKTSWQRFIAWLCAFVYNDISDCPLCQFVCKLSQHSTTKPIKYTFEVKDNAPKVIALDANVSLVELSEHNSTNISVIASFDDNSTEDVTQKATYTSDDSSVDVDKGVITSYAEGSATITIEYADKTVHVQVEVYEMIEGHLLPHEPSNPDATLLGVDKNDNGVRDEVERWIYKDMPTYHHPEIERVIAMQGAKALQMSLIDSSNKNDEVHKAIERTSDCWSYYSYSKDIPMDGAIQKYNNRLKDKQFNTKERLKTYFEYNYSLKGRVFTLTPLRLLNTSYCNVNIDILP